MFLRFSSIAEDELTNSFGIERTHFAPDLTGGIPMRERAVFGWTERTLDPASATRSAPLNRSRNARTGEQIDIAPPRRRPL